MNTPKITGRFPEDFGYHVEKRPSPVNFEYVKDTRPDCSDMSYMTKEFDPNGMQPHQPGAKLDAGKSAVWQGLLDYFPRACLAVADVSTIGARKYAWKGWENVPDGINRYGNALARHVLAEGIEGPFDNGPGGTGVLHAAQVAWNALARLELILRAPTGSRDEGTES